MDGARVEPTRAEYSASDIQVLTLIEAVRRRPGMWTDTSEPYWLAVALIEEAVREHLEQRCFRIVITLHARGALTVADDGPGLPLRHPDSGMFLLERWCTEGCRGSTRSGVFTDLAAINALCESFAIEVTQRRETHRLTYRRGRRFGALDTYSGAERTGNRITIRPDPSIFERVDFDADRLVRRLREISFLYPALVIELVDERRGRELRLGGRGIADWVALLTEGQEAFPRSPLRLQGTAAGVAVDIALRWTTAPSEPRIHAFVDHASVCAGTPHRALLVAVKRALPRGGARRRMASGLVAVVHLHGRELVLRGACRNEIRDSRVGVAILGVVRDGLQHAMRANPEVGGA